MGGRRGGAPRQVSETLRPRPRPVVVGRSAKAELIELLRYVQTQSPRSAALVLERILRELELIALNPEARPVDTGAPELPDTGIAHVTSVSGYTIRYVCPFVFEKKDSVLIVSIRRGTRAALDDPEYVLRWLEERRRDTH